MGKGSFKENFDFRNTLLGNIFFGEPTPFFLYKMDRFSAPLHLAVTVILIFEKSAAAALNFQKWVCPPFHIAKSISVRDIKAGERTFLRATTASVYQETEAAAAASQFIVMQDGL